jgi:hypothetical protein
MLYVLMVLKTILKKKKFKVSTWHTFGTLKSSIVKAYQWSGISGSMPLDFAKSIKKILRLSLLSQYFSRILISKRNELFIFESTGNFVTIYISEFPSDTSKILFYLLPRYLQKNKLKRDLLGACLNLWIWNVSSGNIATTASTNESS